MDDQAPTREELIAELADLRRRVAEFESDGSASITDEKRAEGNIAWSEQKMRLHVEQTPLAVIEWDLQFRVVQWNPGAQRLFGYAKGEALGSFFTFILPLEVCSQVEQVWTDLLAKKGGERSTNQNVTKDGNTILCEWYNTPLVDTAGNVVGFASLVQDITVQKQAELDLLKAHETMERRVEERTAELQASNRRLLAEIEQRRQAEEELKLFKRFVEASTQGFGMADLGGTLTYANPFLARLYGGQTPDDVIGTKLSEHYSDEYMKLREQEVIPALRRGEHWTGELMVRFSDGQLHPTIHSVFAVPDENGQVLCTAAVITDITRLKQAEESLRQSCEELRKGEERYQLAVAGAGVGIWDWDILTGKVYFSPRWKKLFGYGEDDIGDSVEDWIRLLHPDDRADILKLQDDFLASTETNVTAEYRLRHKNGSFRWIVAHAIVTRDESGKACRLVGSHGDITDRKLAEEKVKAEQKALHRMLLASDRERRLVTYELHDGVAQQLMAAIMLLQSRKRPPDDPQDGLGSDDRRDGGGSGDAGGNPGLNALRQASLELRRVMNRLRTPTLDRFGLVEAIEDLVSQFRLPDEAPNIECIHSISFHRLEPTLENSLFRIAQEALTNACRHSKSEKVRIQLMQEDDTVILEIRDWGIGFDQKQISENRFGLEGIRERSRILGGKLKIESRPGEGTVVEVKFPVIERDDSGSYR